MLHVVGTLQMRREWREVVRAATGAAAPVVHRALRRRPQGAHVDADAQLEKARGQPYLLSEEELPDLDYTYERLAKSAKYLHRMADAAVRLGLRSNVPGGSKSDVLDYTYVATPTCIDGGARDGGPRHLDGIADLKDGSTEDQCNGALKNRAFWSVLANPRFATSST